jgi:ArsR family transcriptional regulator, arsenate/arsenite/antimonite-responsive transcriptional repressor
MDTDSALASLRALGQKHRLEAFRQLVRAGAEGLAVGELRDRLQIPPATLSSHLNALRSAGLVRDQREGRVIRVSTDYSHMNSLIDFLTDNCCAGAACSPDVPAGTSARKEC